MTVMQSDRPLISLRLAKETPQRNPPIRAHQNERRQICRSQKSFWEFFPLRCDPFHKFSDGYGILFHVELSVAHRTARAWADIEQDDDDAVPTGTGQFTPEDIEGLSIHST